jgi:hypothetical protein
VATRALILEIGAGVWVAARVGVSKRGVRTLRILVGKRARDGSVAGVVYSCNAAQP